MKLKKIKVVGFKSFADKVNLEFHEGITAIVGPNGCGKSNIADSFRWVMGEQSAKSMRGGKMIDVIFAGSSKRKPLNLSEVSLTFSNQEGRANVPYQEVEITRRYHRDGESEYLINGSNVRLKDVQNVLLDVGVGKNAYAIFEQGKIDQIIQLNPDERRMIFEEAAGILKFLLNKKDALRKLDEVTLNTGRLNDIRSEVAKQISQLETQAEKAIEYKDIKTTLENYERGLQALKIDNFEKRKSSLAEEQAATQKVIEAKSQEIHNFKVQIFHKKEAVEKDLEKLKEEERELYQRKSVKDVREKEAENIKERLLESAEREKHLIKEKKEVIALRESRKKEIISQSSKEKELVSKLTLQAERLEAARKSLFEKEEHLIELRKSYESAQDESLKITRETNEIRTKHKEKQVREENVQEKLKALNQTRTKLKEALSKAEAEESEKKTLLDQTKKEVDSLRERFFALDKEIKAHTEEIENLEPLFETVAKELIDLRARERALKKLRDDKEGFSKGSKELLSLSADPKSPLHNKLKGLYEYIDVQTGFEEAVSSVLKPYADTLVALNEKAFHETLELAKTKKIADYSLVLVKKGKGENAQDSSLLKKVAANEVSRHFLTHKVVVKNLEEALSLVESDDCEEVFSSDGFFIDKLHVIFSSSSKGSSIFLREAELKTLAQKIETLASEHDTYKVRLETLKSKKITLQQERSELDKKLRSLEMTLVERNFHVQKLLQEKERSQNQVQALKDEEATLNDAKIKLQEEIRALSEKLAEEDGALKDKLGAKESLLIDLNKKIDEVKKEKAKVDAEELAFSTGSDESKKCLHAINLLEVKEQESFAQEKRIEDELKELELTFKTLKKKEMDSKDLLLELEGNLEDATETLKTFDEKVRKSKDDLKKREEEFESLALKLKKDEDKLQNLTVQMAQVSTQLDSAALDYVERWGQGERVILRQDAGFLEREIKKLKSDLEGYKNLNLGAVESLEEHKARAKTLQDQIEDFNASSQDLLDIIKKLDDESRLLFQETFEKIRANFKKNFAILFNGGEADLELTRKDDILQAGIEIVAKPPGKQMRSINLLSGGEKCLTAMALLFSIFEVKAAPFCILDEIDAPLDDTNVGRFVEMVKHFVDRCQFIIITHNKRTMAVADRLYGVSMEEKGVSKILKMEFQHNNTQEVALV